MALPAGPTYSHLGVYGNRSRSGPATAYANWLGDGAKENTFLAYCQAHGIDYIAIYGLGSFNNGNQFTTAGVNILRAFIFKAKTVYGIAEIGAVRNFYDCQDPNGDGSSEGFCVVNYNNTVAVNERFDVINIEQEPWNFANNPSSPPGTISSLSTLVTGIGTNFLTSCNELSWIYANGQYRQIKAIGSNTSITIDRPFGPDLVPGTTFQFFNTQTNPTTRFNGTVDYDTYVWRATNYSVICQGASLKLELYLSRNSTSLFLAQIPPIVFPTGGRILITEFQSLPNYNYFRTALQAIASAGVVGIKVWMLVSVESTTFYAGCDDPADCTGSPDVNSNFAGYFLEGKNTAGVPTWAPKSWDDLWDYVVEAAPYVNTPTPSNLGTGANRALNEENDAATIANIDFEGIMIFDQEIVRQLTIVPPDPLSATYTQVNCSANGSSDASINLTVFGGTAPYTFLWNDAVVTEDRAAIPAGTYSVVITDFALDTFTINNIVITEPPPGNTLAANPIIENVLCNGGNQGSINPQISGGSGNYDYTWTGPGGYTSNSPFPQTLIAGTYNLTVLDLTTGYSLVLPPMLITQPVALVLVVAGTAATTGNNGTLTITETTGTVGTVYCETYGPTGLVGNALSYTGLPPGLYTVNYRLYPIDGFFCLVTGSFLITGPMVVRLETTDSACKGYAEGTAQVFVTGGSGVFTYFWTFPTGPTGNPSILNQFAGTYNCLITDTVTGATLNVTAVISEPSVILALSLTPQDPTAVGGTNGWVLATPTGGFGAYTYQWFALPDTGNIVSTASVLSGVGAGDYRCIVTDSGKCSLTREATLRDPAPDEIDPSYPPGVEGRYLIRLDNLKCCAGKLAVKAANAKKIGDSACEKCLNSKVNLLNRLIWAIEGREFATQLYLPATPAATPEMVIDDQVLDHFFADVTIELNGATFLMHGYYNPNEPGFVTALIAFINGAQTDFVASLGVAPDTIIITDNANLGQYGNGLDVSVAEKNTIIFQKTLLPMALSSGEGIAFDPIANRTYIISTAGVAVHVYTGNVFTSTIALGEAPVTIYYNPITQKIYIFEQTQIEVITALAITGSIPILAGIVVNDVAFDTVNQKMVFVDENYVGASDIYMINALDVLSSVPFTIIPAEHYMCVFNQVDSLVWLFDHGGNEFIKFDAAGAGTVISYNPIALPLVAQIFSPVFAEYNGFPAIFFTENDPAQISVIKVSAFDGLFILRRVTVPTFTPPTVYALSRICHHPTENVLAGIVWNRAFLYSLKYDEYMDPGDCPHNGLAIGLVNMGVISGASFVGISILNDPANIGAKMQIFNDLYTVEGTLTGGTSNAGPIVEAEYECLDGDQFDHIESLADEICCGVGCSGCS